MELANKSPDSVGKFHLDLGVFHLDLHDMALRLSRLEPYCVVHDDPSTRQWYQLTSHHLTEAIHWLERARSSGDVQGSLKLGYLYKEQYVASNSPDMIALHKAISYFEEVPEESSSFGTVCEELGLLYQSLAGEVEGAERDSNLCLAIERYNMTAQRNSTNAMYELGSIYFSNYKNKNASEPEMASVALLTSLDWLERAANLGDKYSIYKLATIYADLPDNGYGFQNCPTNLETAIKWYSLACAKGNFRAAGALYKIYMNGPFPDSATAEHWCEVGMKMTLRDCDYRVFVKMCSLA